MYGVSKYKISHSFASFEIVQPKYTKQRLQLAPNCHFCFIKCQRNNRNKATKRHSPLNWHTHSHPHTPTHPCRDGGRMKLQQHRIFAGRIWRPGVCTYVCRCSAVVCGMNDGWFFNCHFNFRVATRRLPMLGQPSTSRPPSFGATFRLCRPWQPLTSCRSFPVDGRTNPCPYGRR